MRIAECGEMGLTAAVDLVSRVLFKQGIYVNNGIDIKFGRVPSNYRIGVSLAAGDSGAIAPQSFIRMDDV